MKNFIYLLLIIIIAINCSAEQFTQADGTIFGGPNLSSGQSKIAELYLQSLNLKIFSSIFDFSSDIVHNYLWKAIVYSSQCFNID